MMRVATGRGAATPVAEASTIEGACATVHTAHVWAPDGAW